MLWRRNTDTQPIQGRRTLGSSDEKINLLELKDTYAKSENLIVEKLLQNNFHQGLLNA